MFISQMIELQVSMKRIQEFLMCDNINKSMVHTVDVSLCSSSVV